jgi:hypothetical protein
LLSAAGDLAITTAAWLLRRRWPGPCNLAFYLVMLAPVSGVVHTGSHLKRIAIPTCRGGASRSWSGPRDPAWSNRRRGRLRRPIVAMALEVMGIWIAGLALTASVSRPSGTIRNALALRHRG